MESSEEPNEKQLSFLMKLVANSAFGLLRIISSIFDSIDNSNLSLVPNQTPDLGSMHGLVETYLTEQFNNLHTKLDPKCTLAVEVIPGSASPWLGNVDGPSFQAAKKAIEVRIHSTLMPFKFLLCDN